MEQAAERPQLEDGEVLDLRLESVMVVLEEDDRGPKSITAKGPYGRSRRYEFGRPIGVGEFATVYSGTCEDGTRVGMKLIDPAKLNTRQRKAALSGEVDILRALKCVQAKHVVEVM